MPFRAAALIYLAGAIFLAAQFVPREPVAPAALDIAPAPKCPPGDRSRPC